MEIQRVESLLRQMQHQADPGGAKASPAQAFMDLLEKTSQQGVDATQAADRFLATGEGELHRVQIELAKADIAFRFLIEIRNKLTDAYQEISRLNL